MPSSTSVTPAADSHRVDAPEVFAPVMHSVNHATEDTFSKTMLPELETNSPPVQDDMTSVEQASLPNAGIFDSDHIFVRENPW